ncbi:MAG: CapA family protein, partial [Anaerolineaceae bacterium]
DVQSSGQPLMTISNRDATKLTVLAMTGVTALARSTAYTMLEKGITYPGENVREVLASADITHISNEVAFAGNCPEPQPQRTGMMFCSDPSYIELLEYIGTDLIELTGDHLADWGQKAIYLTLDMYAEEGWPVYGGGATLQEGQQPVIIEHNGNRLAFLGCNAKGAAFATATDDAPGAVPCDFALLRGQIEQLVSDGYLPIVSIQHNEYDLYEAQEIQIRDFRRLAESGAVIVSGSQSHRPQGMEFYENAFLHYGLGNLFFDQYSVGKPFRQGTIDRHVFYNNRHISTELIPTALIDFAQPRILSGQERDELLEILFTASGWEIRSRDQE